MDLYSVRIRLYPLEHLHCGYGIEQGAVLPAYDYIPGRVVRGGLAGWALRNQGMKNDTQLFTDLFVPEGDEQGEARISFPCCTFKGWYPAPLSLFDCTKRGGHLGVSLVPTSNTSVWVYRGKSLDIVKIDGPVDFLNRQEFPADLDVSYRPYRGTVTSSGTCGQLFHTGLAMKSAHDERTDAVRQEGGLRSEEVLEDSWLSPNRINYQGELIFRDKDGIKGLLEPLWDDHGVMENRVYLDDPPPHHVVFLGRKKVPVAIYAEPPILISTEIEHYEQSDSCTVTLLSECLFPGPDRQVVNKDLFLSLLQDESGHTLPPAQTSRFFCRAGQVHGFNLKKNEFFIRRSIVAGSCARLDLRGMDKDAWSALMKRLHQRAVFGLGCQARDGYGRCKIDWALHTIEEGCHE